MQSIFPNANGWITPDEIELNVARNIVGSFHVDIFELCNIDVAQHKITSARVHINSPDLAVRGKFCHAQRHWAPATSEVEKVPLLRWWGNKREKDCSSSVEVVVAKDTPVTFS